MTTAAESLAPRTFIRKKILDTLVPSDPGVPTICRSIQNTPLMGLGVGKAVLPFLMNKLQGKRIWLTGASYGIGQALAVELASRGAILALTARSADKLTELQARLAAGGAVCHVLTGDVTDLERMKEVAAKLRNTLGGIDILIANAGTHKFTKPEAFDTAEYMGLMDLNFGGMLRCIEAVLPDMIDKRSGHIVGVASLAGFRGLPRAAAYGASKSAAIHFLESIRFHLADHRIPVTIINPGFVRTPLTDKNDFKMPFLVEPDRAARIICDGIARQKDEVAFPFPFSTVIKLMRVLPYPLYKLVMKRVWKKMQEN